MVRGTPLLAGVFAALSCLSTTATAQTLPSWSAIPHSAMGRGSAACDNPGDQGDMFCFGLRCSASDDSPEWFTYQVGGDSLTGEVNVSLVVDGRRHTSLLMKQGETPQGIWSFSTPYDRSAHASAVGQLKSGSGLYVLVGGATGAALSLRGSARALDRALAMCGAGQPQAAAEDAAGGRIAEPFDAVLAMAARQGCLATESEIFEAITGAGFGAWDANLFVTQGTEDGTLTPESGRFRVAGCSAGKDALSVDPDASGLELTADQLPSPVRQGLGEIAAMCGDAFHADRRSPDALLAEDIDGDGTYDFLLDHARFCPSATANICGASHCPMMLFVSDKGSWRRFDFILQGYKEFTENGFLLMCSTDARKAGVFMDGGTLTERDCR